MIEQFKGTSLIDFIDRFPNEEKCKFHLADIKWCDGFGKKRMTHSIGYVKVVGIANRLPQTLSFIR
jgi:hypothetical protein